MQYIWQQPRWPNFTYDQHRLASLLAEIRLMQGRLLGHTDHLELEDSLATQVDTLVQQALETSAIEGESLNVSSVRSSAARRLGIMTVGVDNSNDATDQLVQMLLDSVSNVTQPLSQALLCDWQKSLFTERSIFLPDNAIIGGLRVDESEHPMVVVSRKGRHEIIHFVAPPSEGLEAQLDQFIAWFNNPPADMDGIVRAGIAHLWLVTLHPFSDGNGRVARAVMDRALAQDEKTSVRFYSMSAAIMRSRNAYYDALETAQKSGLDITDWLSWFLETLKEAMQRSLMQFQMTLRKAKFLRAFSEVVLNERQLKVLNRMLDAAPDEFSEGINASRYKNIASTSKPTATRDLSDLVARGLLKQLPGGGRSTRYVLSLPVNIQAFAQI